VASVFLQRIGLPHFRQGLDDFMCGPADSEARPDAVGQANRRLLWLDGFVSNASESFVTNFTNPFIMALNATNSQIGVLSALTNLAGALALLPGARLAERSGQRKWIAAVSGGVIARVLLFVLAMLPLFLISPAIVYATIALVTLRSFFNQLGFPAWSSLIADLVPESIRGRYFSSRNIGIAIAGLIFTPIAGRIIERGGGVRGYQIGFAIAGAVGLIATAIFLRIREPRRTPISRASKRAGNQVLPALRAHPRFVAFSGVALLWNLSIMVAGPFFSVYLVRHLGAPPTLIGILAAVNSVGAIMGQRVWGHLNDRRGATWVMRLTGFLIPGIPLFWSLVPNPWWLIPVEMFSGFTWAGYGLANFNLLLSLAPASQRERFVAIYQMAVFGPAFIGPLIGSVLADALSIQALLWISCAGRLVASLLFMLAVRTGDKASEASSQDDADPSGLSDR
jgi:MFS family permease